MAGCKVPLGAETTVRVCIAFPVPHHIYLFLFFPDYTALIRAIFSYSYVAFYSYFSADLQYSVIYLFSRHLLHPRQGSPAVRSHPLGPGCMMRSGGGRESHHLPWREGPPPPAGTMSL